MTIGIETTYLKGLIIGAVDELRSGTVIPLSNGIEISELKVIDNDNLAVSMRDGEEVRVLSRDEINKSRIKIGSSRSIDRVLGKEVKIFWEQDFPGGEDMQPVPQMMRSFKLAAI